MLVISGIVLALLLSKDEGIKAFNEGRYSAALSKLTEAAKDPNDKEAHLFLALTQAATGDCASALPSLTAMPTEPLAGIAAVKCYSATGQESKAFQLLDEMSVRWRTTPTCCISRPSCT